MIERYGYLVFTLTVFWDWHDLSGLIRSSKMSFAIHLWTPITTYVWTNIWKSIFFQPVWSDDNMRQSRDTSLCNLRPFFSVVWMSPCRYSWFVMCIYRSCTLRFESCVRNTSHRHILLANWINFYIFFQYNTALIWNCSSFEIFDSFLLF